MAKILVEYKSGQSRYSAESVDYMLVIVDGTELYAEGPLSTEDSALDASYGLIKKAILQQADEAGIPARKLRFWFD